MRYPPAQFLRDRYRRPGQAFSLNTHWPRLREPGSCLSGDFGGARDSVRENVLHAGEAPVSHFGGIG